MARSRALRADAATVESTPAAVAAPRRAGHAGLTVDRITAAALEIIRRDGVDGLTMRVLADELGVTVAAAYRHVPNRAAVLELVLDTVLSTVPLPDRTLGPPLERLAMITRASFEAVLAHPGLDALVSRSTAHTPTTRRLRQATVSLLIEAGFDPDTAEQVEAVRHHLWLGSVAVATVTSRRLQAGSATPRKIAAAAQRSSEQLDFAIGLLDAGMQSLLVMGGTGGTGSEARSQRPT
ncbi:MAG: TetR/AcrR family transcriptional regulator [Acidobacteria bacterium]|nr:TetR/AcrR family transcriptional regulator [Acidobacteriota bacterium]